MLLCSWVFPRVIFPFLNIFKLLIPVSQPKPKFKQMIGRRYGLRFWFKVWYSQIHNCYHNISVHYLLLQIMTYFFCHLLLIILPLLTMWICIIWLDFSVSNNFMKNWPTHISSINPTDYLYFFEHSTITVLCGYLVAGYRWTYLNLADDIFKDQTFCLMFYLMKKWISVIHYKF